MSATGKKGVPLIFELDQRTGIARTNVKSVVHLSNDKIRSADLIVGRGDVILRDKRNGRTGHRAGPADYAAYEERAR